MNSPAVLKVETVSKRYEIGVQKTSSGGLRHVLEEGMYWEPQISLEEGIRVTVEWGKKYKEVLKDWSQGFVLRA